MRLRSTSSIFPASWSDMLLNSSPSWANSSRPWVGTECAKSPLATRLAATRKVWICAWSARLTKVEKASARRKKSMSTPRIRRRLSATEASSVSELWKTANCMR